MRITPLPLLPTVEELRARYPGAFQSNRPKEVRKRAILSLYQAEARIRGLGVPEAENPAREALVLAGVKKKVRFGLLVELGLFEPLARAGLGVRDLWETQFLIRASGKRRIQDLTQSDIDALLHSAKSTQARYERRTRLRRIFRVLNELHGDSVIAPSLEARRPAAPRIDDFPLAVQADLVRIADQDVQANFTKQTKAGHVVMGLHAARWLLKESGLPSDNGLAAALLDDDAALRYAHWAARPTTGGKTRKHRSWQNSVLFLLHIWQAAGLSHEERFAKLAKLLRPLNNNGSPSWLVDKLKLGTLDPSPAPSREQIANALSWFEHQIADARRRKLRAKERVLLVHRALFLTPCKSAMRLASLVSMRADQLRVNDQGQWVVQLVKVKRTPRRRRNPPTARQMVGDEERTEWILDGELIRLYEEMFEAFGLDLREYVRSGYQKRELLRWVRPTEDDTFGRGTASVELAPLWLTDEGKRGYLSRGGVEAAITWIFRNVMGKTTGGVHALRRRALLNARDISMMNPRLVEKVHQASRGTQDQYSFSDDMDLSLLVSTYDPFESGAERSQRPIRVDDRPVSPVTAPKRGGSAQTPSAGSRQQSGSTRPHRQPLTLRTLLGR